MKRKAGKRAHSEGKRGGWNKKEDEHLRRLADQVKHSNWRLICKKQNEQFKEKTRTPEECETRFKSLMGEVTGTASRDWCVGETCALLCNCLLHEGSWKLITSSIPDRTRKETSKYLLDMVQGVADLARGKSYQTVDAKNPTETFKIFTCIKLLLDSMSSETSCPPVAKLQRKAQLAKENCLELLDSVGKEAKIGTEWNSEKLNSYLIKAVENIQNSVYSINKEDMDGTLDGLIHEKPEPQVMPMGFIANSIGIGSGRQQFYLYAAPPNAN